jgi:hypothetical protein
MSFSLEPHQELNSWDQLVQEKPQLNLRLTPCNNEFALCSMRCLAKESGLFFASDTLRLARYDQGYAMHDALCAMRPPTKGNGFLLFLGGNGVPEGIS